MAREWHGRQAEGRFLPLSATADLAKYSAEGGEVAMQCRVGICLDDGVPSASRTNRPKSPLIRPASTVLRSLRRNFNAVLAPVPRRRILHPLGI
jgi:hypothetical protein